MKNLDEELHSEDEDVCDQDEIKRCFTDSRLICEVDVASNKKYILQVTGTIGSNPNVALSLSDNTAEVYSLSNSQLAKVAVFLEHSDVITEVRFSSENSNLLYTGSYDGSVRLWDLRVPQKSVIEFKDNSSKEQKQIGCIDVSCNGLLLTGGTNLFEGDAFLLFWDIRKHSLLGGYWECHTDDITQVKFHLNDPNKLVSGSTDGLINLYDLSQSHEHNALVDTLNTGSSIEKLCWLRQNGRDMVSCITHTADLQLWKLEDAQPFHHLDKSSIAAAIKRKSKDFVYIVNVHNRMNDILVLAGSNYNEGECFRGFSMNKNIVPACGFTQNRQRVRSSWMNANINLLLTGGEQGLVNVWETS